MPIALLWRQNPSSLRWSVSTLPIFKIATPNVSLVLAGEAEERASALDGLARTSVLALIVIYSLLAVPLKSYTQPLVVMTSIPFGFIGAVVGH